MVSKQLAKRWAEQRRQREEEERRQRVMVITEFDAGDPEATMHALAGEILRFRLCVRQLADAIELTHSGAEFGLTTRVGAAGVSGRSRLEGIPAPRRRPPVR